MNARSPLLLACLLLFSTSLPAASILPCSPSGKLALADAAAVAELVIHRTRMPEGKILTHFTFRTVETLRGTVPAYFKATAPGGTHGNRADADSRLPSLVPQQTYLLFLVEENGRLGFLDGPAGVVAPDAVDLEALRVEAAALGGGADLSAYATEPISAEYSVTSSGLLDSGGFRRFTLPDQGLGIPVYADVSTLPAGITQQQAEAALLNALAAWEAACSIRFEYKGTQVFTQAADTYSSSDGLIVRVQMHDNFNDISDGGNTLGIGGASYSIDPGNGGTVDGNAFNPITFGYVILNHPKPSLANPVTLEEVLGHEIGHVIGMAHSSETSPEFDSNKAQALMYYLAHADGRGAQLNNYDTSTILQAHPLDTPPYAFDRVLYAVTSFWQPLGNPEVNKVTLEGGDLQGQALTLQEEITPTTNGTFALVGNVLTYTPNGAFSDATVSNPASSWYDRYRARLSDGTHLSPYLEVRVVGFRLDTWPSGAPDGVPDSWVSTYYGTKSGSTAGADTDGDGLDTKTEFLLGTDPTDSASRLKITSFSEGALEWSSQRFDVYRIKSSTDLSTWTTERLVTQDADAATLEATGLPTVSPGGDLFFRVERVD